MIPNEENVKLQTTRKRLLSLNRLQQVVWIN